jgi:dihydrodipicolinate synthase/N-acetylneuraminate lyase
MTFAGIWGFPLTPFREDAPDLSRVQVIADRIVAGGADVVCANGFVAQGDTMSPAERASCLRAILHTVAGRTPVVATLFERHDIARISEMDISGVVVIPPSDRLEDTLALLDAVAERRPELSAVIYHRPPLALQPDDLLQLTERGALVAIKEGHADVRRFRQLRGASRNRLTWVAAHEDLVLPYWALGADGYCPVSAIYAPEYTQLWWAALSRGDVSSVHRLLAAHAYHIADLRFARGSIDISVVKEISGRCSLDAGQSRAPAKRLSPAEKNAIAALRESLEELLMNERTTAGP